MERLANEVNDYLSGGNRKGETGGGGLTRIL